MSANSDGVLQTYPSSVQYISSGYLTKSASKYESNILVGDNVAFLFSDSYNTPYTGKTINDIGEIVNNSANTSWDPTGDFSDRPGAVRFKEIINGLNTNTLAITDIDRRTNANFSVTVPSNFPDNRTGYKYDIPIGYASLDKGFLILTHTGITSNIPWNSGFTQDDSAYVDDGEVSGKTGIYFTGLTSGGDQASLLSFKDVDTTFKTSITCIGMPREFYISNNPTWDRTAAIEFSKNPQSGFINFDPIYITEVGLYNYKKELIAIAKTSEPVQKDYTNVIVVNVDIDM